jgi:hypothetical protein
MQIDSESDASRSAPRPSQLAKFKLSERSHWHWHRDGTNLNLFWAPWRGLSSASRPYLGLFWDGGNSGPTRMNFASCGFELCLNVEWCQRRTVTSASSCRNDRFPGETACHWQPALAEPECTANENKCHAAGQALKIQLEAYDVQRDLVTALPCAPLGWRQLHWQTYLQGVFCY